MAKWFAALQGGHFTPAKTKRFANVRIFEIWKNLKDRVASCVSTIKVKISGQNSSLHHPTSRTFFPRQDLADAKETLGHWACNAAPKGQHPISVPTLNQSDKNCRLGYKYHHKRAVSLWLLSIWHPFCCAIQFELLSSQGKPVHLSRRRSHTWTSLCFGNLGVLRQNTKPACTAQCSWMKNIG